MQRAQHEDDEAAQLVARAEAARREIDDLRTRATEQAAQIEELDGQLARFRGRGARQQEAYAAKGASTRRCAWRSTRRAASSTRRCRSWARRGRASRATRPSVRPPWLVVTTSRIELPRSSTEEALASERVTALTADDEGLRASLQAVRARRDERTSRKQLGVARQATLKADVSRGDARARERCARRRTAAARASARSSRSRIATRASRGRPRHHAAHRESVGGAGIRGVVADIVQPPPELETAVEAVLGERLGNIIVDSHEVGLEAIEFLKSSRSEGALVVHPAGLRGSAPFAMSMAAAPA